MHVCAKFQLPFIIAKIKQSIIYLDRPALPTLVLLIGWSIYRSTELLIYHAINLLAHEALDKPLLTPTVTPQSLNHIATDKQM